MNIKKISVIGGDMRQKYLADFLENKGFTVSAYGVKGDCDQLCETLTEALTDSCIAVLPFPVSPDGVYLNAVCESCSIRLNELFSDISAAGINMICGGGFKKDVYEKAVSYGLKVYDYGNSEEVKIKNALCTAEGALEIALRELPINLHASKSAVLGYGRIGRLLCHRLKALGSEVYAVARKPETLASAETEGMKTSDISEINKAIRDADIIFNTVPSLLLDRSELTQLNRECLIIDLASAPGGVNFSEAERLGLKVIWALSLPGKISPKSAALIIGDAIVRYFDNADS